MRINSLLVVSVAVIAGACAAGCGDDAARPKSTSAAAGAGGACEPQSCSDLHVECGVADDGCGHAIECGEACAGAGGGPGTGDSCADAVLTAGGRNGRQARSMGFAASDDSYLALFDVACDDATSCVTACAKAGGVGEMCDASECLPASQGGNACVPPPVWGSLESIQTEDASVLDMTQIVLADTGYADVLVVDDFGLDVPDGAAIRGITVEVRRAGDASVVDDSVRLVKAGKVVGAEHGRPDAWGDEPAWVSYGAEDDLWSEGWTPAELNAADFGVAVSLQYTEDAGNTRAYIDEVRITVAYSSCD